LEAYANMLRGVAVRHGITLSPSAAQMLTAPVLEASQYPTFDLDEAVRSAELLIMTMAAEHRGLHTAKSVVRAFVTTPGKLPPFTERG
jgi:hypothetical protein